MKTLKEKLQAKRELKRVRAQTRAKKKTIVKDAAHAADALFPLRKHLGLSEFQIEFFDQQARKSLDALLRGAGDEQDIANIVTLLERMAIADKLVDQDLRVYIADAWFALDRADDRLVKNGRAVLDGEGSRAIRELIDINLQLMKVANRGEMLNIIETAKKNFLSKNWQSTKIAESVKARRELLAALERV